MKQVVVTFVTDQGLLWRAKVILPSDTTF